MLMALFAIIQNVLLFLFLLAAFLRLLSWYLREYQDKLLYFPCQPPNATTVVPSPEEWGVPCWEELQVVTPDKTVLHGYFLKQEKDWKEAVTILYFHGNAGNIGHRIPLALALHRTAGCNIVLIEYRGYGLSGGVPTEAGLKMDAVAALEYVHTLDIDKSQIVVMGTSLGGAVAINLTSTTTLPVAGLIVENTFTSISAMVDVLWVEYLCGRLRPLTYNLLTPLFLYCIKPIILQIGWTSINSIPNVTVPILFLSGKKDELIPPQQMHQLYVSATNSPRKLFVPLPNGMHNDTWCSERYFDAIFVFLENNVLQKADPRIPPLEDYDHTLEDIV